MTLHNTSVNSNLLFYLHLFRLLQYTEITGSFICWNVIVENSALVLMNKVVLRFGYCLKVDGLNISRVHDMRQVFNAIIY